MSSLTHLIAQGLGQPDAHLAQPAHTDHAHPLAALGRAPVLDRRVHGDARAEDGPGLLEGEGVGDAGDEKGVDGHVLREAAESVAV